MKIKITADLPVATEVKPKLGEVYEVAGMRNIPTRGIMYTVMIGRGQIGVFENECEVMTEAEQGVTVPVPECATAQEEEPEL